MGSKHSRLNTYDLFLLPLRVLPLAPPIFEKHYKICEDIGDELLHLVPHEVAQECAQTTFDQLSMLPPVPYEQTPLQYFSSSLPSEWS